MSFNDLKWYLSGGVSNTDPNLSLGGVVSTTPVIGNIVTYDSSTVSGVTLKDSIGASVVTRYLHFELATLSLAVMETVSGVPVVADYVDISVNGDYTITSPEGNTSVNITVVSSSLPAGDVVAAAITSTPISQNLYQNVLALESKTGSVKYRHLYLKNESASIRTINLFILKNYLSLNVLRFGHYNDGIPLQVPVDPLLDDELSKPIVTTFNNPNSSAEGQVVIMNPGDYVGVYFERTVLANSAIQVTADIAGLMVEIL